MINFNCYTGMKEPDWSKYDALELALVRESDGECERVGVGEEFSFYTLYAHIPQNGCECIHDFENGEDLKSIVHECEALASRLGFDLYNYTE